MAIYLLMLYQPKWYNQGMYNWSVDTTRLKKDSNKYVRFVLEQSINFGLNGRKLSLTLLKKHWHLLDLDPIKKSYLQKIVWPQS